MDPINPEGSLDISYLENPRLSWAAKGLYSWLLTQPQGTGVEVAFAVSPNREETIAALQELSALSILQFDNPLHAMGRANTTGIKA